MFPVATVSASRAPVNAMRIAAVTFQVLNVNARTNWSFVRVELDGGAVGTGEASLNGYEPLLDACVRALAATLVGTEVEAGWRHLVTRPHAPGGLAQNAAKSAVAQALADAEARAAGVSLTQWLGGARRARVPVYANINRATVDRSPDGCARSAQAAVAAGWPAVKIAPFDGVFPDALDRAETRRAIDVGVARVAAIRAAVGAGAGVMVDCHWRFDEPTAVAVLERLAPYALGWFECPVSEQPASHPALSRLRAAAHALHTRIAACELQSSVDGFRPFVAPALAAAPLVDAIMPDVKYCGGPAEMLRIAAFAQAHGVAFSPHNPTGPVCTYASLAVAACADAVESLEVQLGESDLLHEVVGGARPVLVDGCYEVPAGLGVGVVLDDRVLAAHPYHPVPPFLDERLG